MTSPEVHTFQSGEELAVRLADRIAGALVEALEERDSASLVVSGGRTPERLFSALSTADLDWVNVEIFLADERWVPDLDQQSNARFLRKSLLVNAAGKAKFSALWNSDCSADDAAEQLASRLRARRGPFDAVILGMGEDGHTASLFPDAPEIDHALSARAPQVMTLSPASQPVPRISLTPSALTNARFVALHIEGQGKWDVLQRALSEGPDGALPVRTILRNDKTPVEVYWSP